ncbi:hypothetical protein HNR31_003449 [Anoxybacillus caldiproteolyticus]|uniref:Uncharacterized protein n=1 Tax=Thermaerobacillus caldiproteolyticus TaxID=247480 RepID=A0A7V9ZA09_9BACL|nr:hypothetical protein [Anoxybacillus caldiproteolyticus]
MSYNLLYRRLDIAKRKQQLEAHIEQIKLWGYGMIIPF